MPLKKSTPRRQIIVRIPHGGMSAEDWGSAVQNELLECWAEKLTPAEQATVNLREVDKTPNGLLAKLDEEIIYQTANLGFRITLSELVRFRLSEWERNEYGLAKIEAFTAAWQKFAKIVQRKVLPSLDDPLLNADKRVAVEELRRLLSALRSQFSVIRRDISDKEAFQAFQTKARELNCELALAHFPRWKAFFESHPAEWSIIKAAAPISPSALYDQFQAKATGWKVESLRQRLTELKD